MAENTNFQNRVGKQIRDEGKTYTPIEIVGKGSFGSVYKVKDQDGNQLAIKKVYQDRRYRNRELQISEELNHPNVVYLKHAFFTPGQRENDMYLNIVMEFIPDTAYRILRQFQREGKPMPAIYIKLYAYQLLRAIAYTHGIGVCHRDIKPQNLLVDK